MTQMVTVKQQYSIISGAVLTIIQKGSVAWVNIQSHVYTQTEKQVVGLQNMWGNSSSQTTLFAKRPLINTHASPAFRLKILVLAFSLYSTISISFCLTMIWSEGPSLFIYIIIYYYNIYFDI